MDGNSELRKLPSVDRLLGDERIGELIEAHGRDLVVQSIRSVLDEARDRIRAGMVCPSEEELVESIAESVEEVLIPTLRRVINATGVIIHTNLGRSPLSEETRQAMVAAGTGYSNLEFDLETGQRGSRYIHAEALLRRLTGAESALVVNNNAAAVLLVLSALARGKEVIISRSQLIEIGGGFRIPEVMAQSGAKLIEVGTTNRTRIADFENAITDQTALLMRVHHSNFKLIGFTEEPSLSEMVHLGQRYGVSVVDDLGSGTLLDTRPFGLDHEPTIQESVAAGAALVTCSGDKLLGAPQAGIIVGKQDLIQHLRRFPLARALRVDKVTLAGLQATLLHYVRQEAVKKIPTWQMIARREEDLKAMAEAWAGELQAQGLPAFVLAGESTVGGGSLPGATLPTWHVALSVPSPAEFAARLRKARPAILVVVKRDHVLLDPRTVQPGEEDMLLRGVLRATHQ